jgi:hypothetical protein
MRFFWLFCLILPLLASCSGNKTPAPHQEAPKAAETQPKDPQLDRVKEEALRQLEGHGLGIISAHPDTKDAPPTIFSPDAFPKARPDAPKSDLKQ